MTTKEEAIARIKREKAEQLASKPAVPSHLLTPREPIKSGGESQTSEPQPAEDYTTPKFKPPKQKGRKFFTPFEGEDDEGPIQDWCRRVNMAPDERFRYTV